MDFNDTRRHTVRSRRSIFLIALTSFALSFSALGMAPAAALDADPAADSWQADAIAETATLAELRAEVADGELRMLVIRDDSGEPDATVVTVADVKSLDRTLKTINQDDSVISIQVDQKVSLLAPTMTSIAAAAPTVAYTQWNYSALRLGEIHSSLRGTNITVAVIDSGVDRTGSELNDVNQVLDGCDWVTSPTNDCIAGRGIVDENGHGTHVAGIIAAKNDGLGITGVAPNVTILPLRVLDANGNGYLSDVAAAIDYAVLNNAKVINMSLGGTTDFSLIRQAVVRAAAAGVIIIAAAGNSGANGATSYPAAYPEVIAVAATTSGKIIAEYSNGGNYIDVAAPGDRILSSWPTGTGYARLSGTSMAAPHVAGLAALLLEKNVLATPAEVKNQIETTALKNDVGGYGITDYSLARYGAGFIDIYGALGCGGDLGCTPPASPVPVEEEPSAPLAQTPPTLVEAPSAPVQAPAPAPAIVSAPAPIVVTPTIKATLSTKALTKRRIVVKVKAPRGSTTLIQRKVGKKWKTEIKRSSRASQTFRVKRLGTYRVVIVAPNERATSKSFKARR